MAHIPEAPSRKSLMINRADDETLTTPLHAAAALGRDETVTALLAASAVIDARDADGATPLFHAVKNGHTVVAECLIEAQGNVDVPNAAGCGPIARRVALGVRSSLQGCWRPMQTSRRTMPIRRRR